MVISIANRIAVTMVSFGVAGAAGVALAGSAASSTATTASAAATSTTASTVATATPHWQLVWSDDFEGDALDRSKWIPEESCWGGGNQERQCYTDRADNIAIADGVLQLIAQPESYVGPRYPAHSSRYNREQVHQEYTSGKLNTIGLAEWKYGRISARMKLPAGQGTWPAFWMLPADNAYGSWPLSGEIDIMEAVNLDVPCADSIEHCPRGIDHRTSGAVHFGKHAPHNSYIFAYSHHAKPAGPAQEWHVYSVEWAQGVIQWFVDGKLYMRVTAEDWYSAGKQAQGRFDAPFDQPFYIALNLAVGGGLSENGDSKGFDPASFPTALLVDWVRVEQCAGDLASGRACLTKQAWQGKLHRHGEMGQGAMASDMAHGGVSQ